MVDQTVVENTSSRSYVDWPAIFAGATIASGSMIVLSTFAGGLGLSSFSVDDGSDISIVWLIITALFLIASIVGSYMLGGYITGRMRRPAGSASRDELTTRDGLNGLVVWGIGTILSALFAISVLSSGAKAVGSAAQTTIETAGDVVGGAVQGTGQIAGGLISGAGSAMGGLAQGAGEAAGPSIEQMLPQGLKANPVDYLTDTLVRTDGQMGLSPDTQTMADFQRQIGGILGNLLSTGEIADSDKAWLTSQIATRTGLSQNDAQTRVNQTVERVQAVRAEAQEKVDQAKKQIADIKAQAEKALEDAKNQAVEAAETARVTGILSAFLLAASALVAAVAAYIGAVHGGRHRDEGRIWGGLAYRK